MTLTWQWIGYPNIYLQGHLIPISPEEPAEEEVGISQVSPVVGEEEAAEEEEVDLYMDEVKEEYLDMDKVKEVDLDMDEVELEEAVEAVEAAVVDVV